MARVTAKMVPAVMAPWRAERTEGVRYTGATPEIFGQDEGRPGRQAPTPCPGQGKFSWEQGVPVSLLDQPAAVGRRRPPGSGWGEVRRGRGAQSDGRSPPDGLAAPGSDHSEAIRAVALRVWSLRLMIKGSKFGTSRVARTRTRTRTLSRVNGGWEA